MLRNPDDVRAPANPTGDRGWTIIRNPVLCGYHAPLNVPPDVEVAPAPVGAFCQAYWLDGVRCDEHRGLSLWRNLNALFDWIW